MYLLDSEKSPYLWLRSIFRLSEEKSVGSALMVPKATDSRVHIGDDHVECGTWPQAGISRTSVDNEMTGTRIIDIETSGARNSLFYSRYSGLGLGSGTGKMENYSFKVKPLPYVTENVSTNEKQQSWWTSLTANVDDNKYTIFLQYLDPEDQLQYNEFSKNQVYAPVFWFFFLMLAAIIIPRSALSSNFLSPSHLGPLSFATIAFILVSSLTFLLYAFGRHFYNLTGLKPWNRADVVARYIIKYLFFDEIESFLLISIMLTCSMTMITRVITGQCVAGATFTGSINCNMQACSQSPPLDSTLGIYLCTFCIQIVIKNVRKWAILLSWCIGTGALLWSLIYLDSSTNLSCVIYSAFNLLISYEIERTNMSTFLRSNTAVKVEKSKLLDVGRQHEDRESMLLQLNAADLSAQQSRHDLEILALSTQNEKELMETQAFQLRSLMGNVAHDLKTPIHSIVMDIEVLKRTMFSPHISGTNSPKQSDQAIDTDVIFDSLDSTCNIMMMGINRCLDYMKSSSNILLVPIMETFLLTDVVAVAARIVTNHLNCNGSAIVIHPLGLGICPYVISDKHWLNENALCLLSNAVKYSDRGSPVNLRIELESAPLERQSSKARVKMHSYLSFNANSDGSIEEVSSTAEVETVGTVVRVSVEDAGIGIPEETRSSLFNPFKQAQRMAGGTGLGLYSMRKRMEALDGSCGVTSRRDGKQGSEFWFTFPYRPDLSAADESAFIHSFSSSLDYDRSIQDELKILLVDDSGSILKITGRSLRTKGHVVTTAENGSLGLQKLIEADSNQETYDILLTDLQMPVMDGFEFVKRYRKFESKNEERGNQRERDSEGEKKEEKQGENQGDDLLNKGTLRKGGGLLIIGMSANSDVLSQREAFNSGMDIFLSKPFTYKDFEDVISQYSKNRGSEKSFKKSDFDG